jgi:hypothetical protein
MKNQSSKRKAILRSKIGGLKKKRVERFPLEEIPNEILIKILDLVGNWKVTSRVCKLWRNLTRLELCGQDLFDSRYQSPVMVGWIFLKFLKQKLFHSVDIGLYMWMDGHHTTMRLGITMISNDTVRFRMHHRGGMWGPKPHIHICKRFGWTGIGEDDDEDKDDWEADISHVIPAFHYIFQEWMVPKEAGIDFSCTGWKNEPSNGLFFMFTREAWCHYDFYKSAKELYQRFLDDENRSNFLDIKKIDDSDPLIAKEIALIPRSFWKEYIING